MKRFCWLLALGLLAGCGAPEAGSPLGGTPAPTFAPILSRGQGTATPAARTPAPASLAAAAPTTTAAPSAAGSPSPTAGASDDPLDQYRAWIAEARVKHPYAESTDAMWYVMLCESSGNPSAEGGGGLTGLFQYTPQTWSGDWNPYRDRPMTDARAQIFATAKAWSDGYQQWWQVCLPG